MNIASVTALLLFIVNSANPLNILAIYPYNGKSHFLVYRVLLRELANRGHNITVISHFPEKAPPKNYHDISLSGSTAPIEDSEYPIQNKYWAAIMDGLYIMNTAIENCEVLLRDEDVQALIKQKPKFDVILFELFNSECPLAIGYKLGAPVVAMTSNVMMPFHNDIFGITNNPSYVYFHFLGGGTRPNLKQRLERVIFNFYHKVLHYIATQRNQNTIAKYFDDIPALEDLAREIKFLLVYHNFVLTGSKLLPANVIEVGGYHVQKAQPLSGDLRKFVEDAEHGVIYISFGSLVRSSSLPSDKINAILEAMDEFPQRFIWKWENETLPAAKDKVYFDRWLPQVDILGHPKVLAFFSHAGMGGTTEALAYGVPILAMPIDGDQPCNAALIEENGLGIQLLFEDFNKDNLVAALKKVLDPKFRAQVKKLSSASHDRPTSALDTAVFWTEFAARHPQLSLRTRSADVPFYQYFCLDIFIVLALPILTVISILKLIKAFRESYSQKLDSKKKQKKKKSD